MIHDLLRSNKWLILMFTGVLLFCAGIFTLRHNPYWRHEPGQPGFLDHHVYAFNGIGHLTVAVGLLSVVLGIALLLSRLFPGKWSRLYWFLIVIGVSIWCAAFGVQTTYILDYTWDRKKGGVTDFTLANRRSVDARPNWLTQHIIWWQVKPELTNYLGGSPINHTRGRITVDVVRIVPIALPTLDCDCFHCCIEEGHADLRK